MAARVNARGRVTLPKKVRAALRLTAGDGVEFTFNDSGEVVVHKAAAAPVARARTDKQVRRRAAELSALLRGLD